MPYILLLLIIFFANRTFSILPIAYIPGVFNTQDIGLLLVFVMLFRYVIFRKGGVSGKKLANPYTFLIVLYLFFMLLQAAFASFKYDQSIVDGLIRARHQFYHLVFFPMLLILDSSEKMSRMMKYLTVMTIILIILSLINYFGITIFSHRWAEGHHMRSGITRALVVGSNFIVFTALWQIVSYLEKARISTWQLIYFVVAFAMVIFRQTRSRILAFTIVLIMLLINKRKYGLMAALMGAGIIVGSVTSVYLGENILLSPFKSAYTDITQHQGTWAGRIDVMKRDLDDIGENIYFGNGALVVREGGTRISSVAEAEEIAAAGKKGDIGYMHFFKFFGLPGLIWMLVFIVTFYRILKSKLRSKETDMVNVKVAGYMFTFIVIAEFTLDFFLAPANIVILYLTIVMLINSYKEAQG